MSKKYVWVVELDFGDIPIRMGMQTEVRQRPRRRADVQRVSRAHQHYAPIHSEELHGEGL